MVKCLYDGKLLFNRIKTMVTCSRSECPGDGVLANGETGTWAEWANGLSGLAPGNIEI